MSDSASRTDVEDVLSSVRRLVSSEVPRTRRPDLPKGPGALVLTDAQRVEKAVSKGRAAKSLEDRIAELEAAVSSREDEYEPDGSEDQSQHRPDRMVYSRPPDEAERDQAKDAALRLNRLSLVRPVTSRDEDAKDDEPVTESPRVRFRHARQAAAQDEADDTSMAQEAPMAEDVSDTSPPESAELRPFRNPDDMVGRVHARMDGDELGPPPGPGHNGFSERLEPYESNPEVQEATTDASADTEPSDDDDFEAALSEALAKPEADVAPDEPDDDADRPPSDEDEPSYAAPTVEPVGSLTEDALEGIDEELLRPLVAKLIREELQGELGERITRNVRKLVRREILRAINSSDFE